MRQFHKPVHRPAEVIEAMANGSDPAQANALAHDTAAALLHRVRAASDPSTVERLIAYANEHGIDDVAELWASAPPHSLPGALWRLYLVRHLVHQSAQHCGYVFRRGLEHDTGVNQAIAGSPDTPSPEEVAQLATEILAGAFVGDFYLALRRCAAFCHVMALGYSTLLDDNDAPERQHTVQRQHRTFETFATDLQASAQLWRSGHLH